MGKGTQGGFSPETYNLPPNGGERKKFLRVFCKEKVGKVEFFWAKGHIVPRQKLRIGEVLAAGDSARAGGGRVKKDGSEILAKKKICSCWLGGFPAPYCQGERDPTSEGGG